MIEKSSNPLSCSRATEWLHLLMDTELSSADHERLLAHLQTCERCRAAQRELSMIEAAHPQLDTRLRAAPQDYFVSLPQQIMARIEETEAAHARPRSAKLPAHSFDVREFIFGRAKYALAFAAVLALAFILTRQLRGPEPSATATKEMMLRDAPAISRAEEESSLQSEALTTNEAYSSVADDSATRFKLAATVDTNSSGAASEFAAVSLSEEETIGRADESSQTALQAAIPPPVGASDTAAKQSSLLAGAPLLVNNPQGGRAEVAVESRDVNRFDAAQEPLALSKAISPATTREMRATAVDAEQVTKAASSIANDIRLSQTLSAAVQATTQAERLKIWQAYFSDSLRDSASHTASVENLAQRLLAQSDSSASVTQMQETLSFYQTMETVLASRWGQVAYEREKARLEGLLNWKKSAQP